MRDIDSKDLEKGSEYYTPAELSTKTSMSKKWVETHTQARRIPGQKQFGRSWRYLKAAVELALQNEQFLLPATTKNAGDLK